ncbi:hypothetical protein F8S09_04605 [Deinococcus sp. SDU3-2]|uniref:Uncharacterized protein n=1 Tax=Deinococcus terrestris TaxID=2651870 RepID=A0A7X1NUD3_9DEIO|nr:hypothetical protein [Deinococcus terrestris]MPY65978.1 hypothetical protein [Deinococcus terrestris]
MPYHLTIEIRSNSAAEHFQREFGSLLDAKRYAHNQVRGDIFWTVRENCLEGLAPSDALRIEATGEDVGRPLDEVVEEESEAPVENTSLFTPDGPVEEPRSLPPKVRDGAWLAPSRLLC